MRAVHRYIANIRNLDKKNYAENYLQCLVHGWQINEDYHATKLCAMARQAVRINIMELTQNPKREVGLSNI